MRLRTRSGDPTDQECNFAKRTQLTHAKSGGCHCTYPKHDSITLSLILCVCVAMVPSTAGELRRQIPEFLKRLQYGSYLSSTTIEPSSYRNRQRNRPSLTGSHLRRFDDRAGRIPLNQIMSIEDLEKDPLIKAFQRQLLGYQMTLRAN